MRVEWQRCVGGLRIWRGVMVVPTGFSETMEVRCVQKWESANVCMTVFKSGKVKIVGVKSRDKALFVLKTFVSALRKVKGFHDASLDINEGFTLGVSAVSRMRVYKLSGACSDGQVGL